MSSVATRSAETGRRHVRPGDPWHGARVPTTVAEASAILDRMALHCTYGCGRAEDCAGNECEGWRLEQAAAEFLARHWADAER